MVTNGFYLMARGWTGNRVFGDESYCRRSAWVWLIEHAAFRTTEVSVAGLYVNVLRGQLAASIRYLAAVWGWGVNRVQHFLDDLRRNMMVDTATDTGITVITICNYERYQFPVEVADTRLDTGADTPTDTSKKETNKYPIGRDSAPANSSIKKALFDGAVSYLGEHGRQEKESRSLVAKWIADAKRWSRKPELEVIDVIDAAKREGIADPVSWIFASLKQRANGSGSPRSGACLL